MRSLSSSGGGGGGGLLLQKKGTRSMLESCGSHEQVYVRVIACELSRDICNHKALFFCK